MLHPEQDSLASASKGLSSSWESMSMEETLKSLSSCLFDITIDEPENVEEVMALFYAFNHELLTDILCWPG